MKGIIYFLVLLFIASIVYSVIKLDFEAPLFSQVNFNQWLVICSAICGLLLSFILLRFQVLKSKLKK